MITLDYQQELIRSYLIKCASRRQTVTYSTLCIDLDLPYNFRRSIDRKEIGEDLGIISQFEAEHDRPLLSAIVVYSSDRRPSAGFASLAISLGKLSSSVDSANFALAEKNRVFEYWAVRESRNIWTRDELIITLSLYFQLPFGRLNQGTPEVRRLAELMVRTDSSVAMRLTNFAACDPYIIESGRSGLPAGKEICQPIWDEFCNNRESLFIEAEKVKAKLKKVEIEDSLNITETDLVGTTREAVVKQRVNQNVFRSMILNNYESKCAVTGISVPSLLVASHIIPWSVDEKERLNPENGICLSSLYDKAFDQGLIGIDDHYKIILSDEIKKYKGSEFYDFHFGKVERQEILLPEEHKPNKQFLEWHRDCILLTH